MMYGDEEEVCACNVEEGVKEKGWCSGWGGDGEGLRWVSESDPGLTCEVLREMRSVCVL